MFSHKDQKDVYKCECKAELDTKDDWNLLKHIRRCELFASKSEFHKAFNTILYRNRREMPTIGELRVLQATLKVVQEQVDDTINSYEFLAEARRAAPAAEEVVCAKCQTVLNFFDPTLKTLLLNSCTHQYHEACLLESMQEGIMKQGVFRCCLCMSQVPDWEIKVYYTQSLSFIC